MHDWQPATAVEQAWQLAVAPVGSRLLEPAGQVATQIVPLKANPLLQTEQAVVEQVLQFGLQIGVQD